MSANRLFLVCTAHPAIEDSFCIGERAGTDPRYDCDLDLEGHLDAWYRKHSTCGNGPDHYQLAHHRPPNHDVATPQSALGPAVRLALANGGN